MKLKIAQIFTGADSVAGVQRHVVWLASKSSHQHCIFLPPRPAVEAYLKEVGVPFIVFPTFLHAFFSLKKFRPNILHCHLGTALLLGAFFSLLCPKVKLIYTHHLVTPASETAGFPIRFLKRIFLRYAYSRAQAIIAVSELVRQEVLKRKESTRVSVIVNGVPLPESVTPKQFSLPLQVLVMSRLDPDKNPEDILQVAKELNDNRVQIHVHGNGALSSNLRIQASQLKSATPVIFHGYSKHPEEEFQKAHLSMNVSIVEAFSLATAESLVQGVPVVGYKNGVNETLCSNNSGILVKAKDTRALALAIRKFLDEPHLLEQMSLAAREQREWLSLARWIKETDDLYELVNTSSL